MEGAGGFPCQVPPSEHGARRGPACSARPTRRHAALGTIRAAHVAGVLPARAWGQAEAPGPQASGAQPSATVIVFPVAGREGSRLNRHAGKPETSLCRKGILPGSPQATLVSEELTRLSGAPFAPLSQPKLGFHM